jgi:regulator of protease activity HflC (stomatin/prohibitin superfamily)
VTARVKGCWVAFEQDLREDDAVPFAQKAEAEVKKKQAEAAQAEAEAQGKAKATRALAEGEAQAITLKAEAQARANRILAESLTPALIQYQHAIRWDGKLPTVTSGSIPMIQLPSEK